LSGGGVSPEILVQELSQAVVGAAELVDHGRTKVADFRTFRSLAAMFKFDFYFVAGAFKAGLKQ
jgi:hypothetical protein